LEGLDVDERILMWEGVYWTHLAHGSDHGYCKRSKRWGFTKGTEFVD
jgi:hypothetical protein